MARTVNPRPTRRLVLVGAGLVLGLAACSSAGGGDTLDARAFGEASAKPGVTILDVRTPEEFAAGYIPGAINVDLNGPDFKGEVGKLPKDGEYAVYCRSGNRSATALAQMKELGFTNAYHLAGGIGAWQAAGGEIAVATP
ncbi:MAG: rhodanese-like domain-containing protein [Actinobacteria bacterium]|jgi:Rhodanese-related sulfurtransferase|nr:rhodanese-like domain-containing protein [Actinomycetota bacterium]